MAELYTLRDRLKEARAAGDRLAIMLRAQMGTTGYGSPEHEDRCREALREWEAIAPKETEA